MIYYENLAVYKKAFAVNQQIYRFLKQNKSIPSYVKNQLGRSSLSVMLNIAEGTAKHSLKDRRNFYITSRGSTFESVALIKFLVAEEELTEEFSKNCADTFEEISKMLFVMIRNLSEERK